MTSASSYVRQRIYYVEGNAVSKEAFRAHQSERYSGSFLSSVAKSIPAIAIGILRLSSGVSAQPSGGQLAVCASTLYTWSQIPGVFSVLPSSAPTPHPTPLTPAPTPMIFIPATTLPTFTSSSVLETTTSSLPAATTEMSSTQTALGLTLPSIVPTTTSVHSSALVTTTSSLVATRSSISNQEETSSPTASPNSENNTPIIAGSVGGAVALLLSVIAGVVIFVRRRSNKDETDVPASQVYAGVGPVDQPHYNSARFIEGGDELQRISSQPNNGAYQSVAPINYSSAPSIGSYGNPYDGAKELQRMSSQPGVAAVAYDVPAFKEKPAF